MATFASLLEFDVGVGDLAGTNQFFKQAFGLRVRLNAELRSYRHRKHHDDGRDKRHESFRHARAYPINNGAPQRREL